MIDPVIISSAAALLTPLLPYLAKPVAKAAEKIAEEIGKDTWDRAKEVWNKLFSGTESSEISKTVEKLADKVETVEQSGKPEEEKVSEIEKYKTSLEVQIEMLLEGNPQLASEINKLITQAQDKDNGGAIFTVHSQIAKNIINARDINTITMT